LPLRAALGIGGIMGGEPSSVTEGTTAVFLESALFEPAQYRPPPT